MRDGWTSKWGWRVGAVVLVGGLILWTSSVVTQAGERDDDHHGKNPFDRVLHKLDKILDAIKDGGGQEGHHTLRWDTNHPSASRFVVLKAFNNQAVLDKNTGLVWEQAPEVTRHTWDQARHHCANRSVGGTVGWRLPSGIELRSLQDPTLAEPFVPTTVFTGEWTLAGYWSGSTNTNLPADAWGVDFRGIATSFLGDKASNLLYAWCVRGPMQEHEY